MEGRQQAVRLGRFIATPQPDDARRKDLATRLARPTHNVLETTHFVVIEPRSRSRTILLHPFSQAILDADLFSIVERELGATGVIGSASEYDQALNAIVASTSQEPEGERIAWHQLCLNTLARLRIILTNPSQVVAANDSHIAQFAAIYRRVMELRVGASLLDIGTSFGFLPILVGERDPTTTVVGCDVSRDAIAQATNLAIVAHSPNVSFQVCDVLAGDFRTLGQSDTVTAIHLLEHLADDELPVALTHMLDATTRRLIVSVPYEQTVKPLYGHQQVFNPEKLQVWGERGIEMLKGGRFWCEDVGGGFLVVDRQPD